MPKTLDRYNSLNTNGMQASDMVNANSNSTYGIHPEYLKNIDYVTESIREKIQSGKYVNLACLLIPEYELVSKEKKLEKQKDMRLNRSLTIEEFILAFNKYKRIHCARHAWRKPELNVYELIIIEISAVYGPKFYEYRKLFEQKCAAALTMGQKLNWAEKDKDLLQMKIGGVPSKVCQIFKKFLTHQHSAYQIHILITLINAIARIMGQFYTRNLNYAVISTVPLDVNYQNVSTSMLAQPADQPHMD